MITYRIFFLIFFVLTYDTQADPIKKFYVLHSLAEKSVFVTMDLSACGTCQVSVRDIVLSVRSVNPDIPIYVFCSDSLNGISRHNLGRKHNLDTGSVYLVYDRCVYQCLSKTLNGNSGMAYISEKGKIIAKAKSEGKSVNRFFQQIVSEFRIFPLSKTLLINSFTEIGKKYNNLIICDSQLMLFRRGLNLIASYKNNGLNTANFLLDSLEFNYISLSKQIFPKDICDASISYFLGNKLKTAQVLNPISIFRVGRDKIGVNYELKAFSPGVYKGDSVIFEDTYPFIQILNDKFKPIELLQFPQHLAKELILYSQCAYSNNNFYYSSFDKELKIYTIVKFSQMNNQLILNRKIPQPIQPESKDPLQILSNLQNSDSSIFLTYNNAKHNRVRIYKMNGSGDHFKKVLHLTAINIPGYYIYETPKGNLLFLGIQNGKIGVFGFDTEAKRLVKVSKNYQKTATDISGSFIFDGFIHKFSFCE